MIEPDFCDYPDCSITNFEKCWQPSITQAKIHNGMLHKGVTQRCSPGLFLSPDKKNTNAFVKPDLIFISKLSHWQISTLPHYLTFAPNFADGKLYAMRFLQ